MDLVGLGGNTVQVMRLDDRVIGKRLGHAIYDRNSGKLLLNAHVELTTSYVDRLVQRGYRSVPIYDPLAPDAVPHDVVREETRAAAAQAVNQAFARVGSREGVEREVAQVREIVDLVLKDILSNPDLVLNLSSLRSMEEGVFVHSVNVCVYALILAGAMALSNEEKRTLGVGAMFHDLGKVYYMELVQKPGKLTDEEYQAIKRHTTDGFEILRRQRGVSVLAAHMALQHHERLDGSGYPRALNDAQMHPWAKLVAVADVYDTVTADRTYGQGLAPHEAMAELNQMAVDGKIERRLVHYLMRRLAAYPEGTILLLQTGAVAVVVGQSNDGQHPRIRVLTDGKLAPIPPEECLLDGTSPATSLRSVLPDYPLLVRERLAPHFQQP